MRLYTFQIDGKTRIGAELNGQLIDLQPAYTALVAVKREKEAALQLWPSDMLSFIRLGEPALSAVRDTLAFISKRPALPVGERGSYLFEEIKILAPIPRPGKYSLATSRAGRPSLPAFVPLGRQAQPPPARPS